MPAYLAIAPNSGASGSWDLNSADKGLAGMPIRFALAFGGELEGQRLRDSIEACLHSYPAFFARLDGDGGRLFVDADLQQWTPVKLFFSYRLGHLPSMAMSDLQSLAVCEELLPQCGPIGRGSLLSLRATSFDDGWVLGIACDHVVTDLHGLYGFLVALGRVYSDELYPEGPEPASINISRPRSPEMSGRFGRIARCGVAEVGYARNLVGYARYLAQDAKGTVPVAIMVDPGELNGDNGPDTPTSNDYINAALLSARAAVTDGSSVAKDILLTFPMNARALLGLPSYELGNLLVNVSFSRSAADIRAMDIHDLARLVKTERCQTGLEAWMGDDAWGEYWSKRVGRLGIYHRWLFGADRVYSSNWASRRLDEMRFNDCALVGIYRSPYGIGRRWLPSFHATILPSCAQQRRNLIVRTSFQSQHVDKLSSHLLSIGGVLDVRNLISPS